MFLQENLTFVSSKGLKSLLHFFFSQHLSGAIKNVSYPAAVLTELKLESSLSYPGKNIISNIFLFSNPYVAQ